MRLLANIYKMIFLYIIIIANNNIYLILICNLVILNCLLFIKIALNSKIYNIAYLIKNLKLSGFIIKKRIIKYYLEL